MKTTNSFLRIITCMMLVVTASVTVAQQNEKKKLNFKEGQKFQTENSLKTTSSMEMMGQQMDVNANITASRQFEIKTKKQNTYGAAMTITKMALTGDMMGQSISYDSEKEEDKSSEMGKAIGDKLNTPTEMEIDEEGRVTSIQKNTVNNDSAQGGGVDAMLKSLGAGADESAVADDMFILTPTKLKQGDSWSDSIITEGVKMYRTYTVKSIQGNDIVVTITGKQLFDKKITTQGMEMTMTMESKITGDATVDAKSNIAKQKNLTTEGSGTLEMMGQQVPLTSKVEAVSSTKML